MKNIIDGFEIIKDILESLSFISSSFGLLALVFAYKAYKTSFKQLNSSIILSCATRFHQVTKNLKQNPDDRFAIEDFYALCNEELFYFKYEYLPKEVVVEWLSSMFPVMPHFVGNQNFNPMCIPYIVKEVNGEENNLLGLYRRLKGVFTFRSETEYRKLILDQKKLVKYLLKNLKYWNKY